MGADKINKLAEDLERQELEAPNGIASAVVYAQLLAIYLYQNDLCNAKFLWKRIPPDVKSSNAELGRIWAVGQAMWKRDFAGVYKALSGKTWSENVAEIMQHVQEKVRSRAVDLISQAYSSISVDTVAQMTGLGADVAGSACLEKGWQIEPDTRIVHPVRPPPEATGHISSEDQLNKLTDFVSFLET